MFQAFSTDYDSASRCSNSPSIGDPFYFSPADSFSSLGSPAHVSDPGSELAPSLTALSRRPELQWMVQPTLSPRPRHEYSLGAPYRARAASSKCPGRRGKTDQLSPEDEEKRKVRRERNKLAAAKCRNRRRELTDSLQTETEKLEGEKSVLETEVAELLKEKEKLEFILAAHRPVCRIPEPEAPGLPGGSSMERADPERAAAPAPGLDNNLGADLLGSIDTGRSVPDVDLINLADWEPLYSSLPADCEPLCTPVLPATPSGSYSSSFAFSYPELAACGSSLGPGASSDHSSDSLNSPTLLAL
ncbi:protein c-Fos-like [Stegostoma tigrinum]|uniref:protein c-Fos-like n=1 Tax=Stegostoma tigrinum TaxID=3053191 RepID=UPI0028702008|nr:protein c-Fos-like [Stegostoma tigrinum]